MEERGLGDGSRSLVLVLNEMENIIICCKK